VAGHSDPGWKLDHRSSGCGIRPAQRRSIHVRSQIKTLCSRWHWPIRLGRIRLRKRLQPTEGWTRPSYVWVTPGGNSTIAAQAAEFVPRKGGASTCVPKSKPSCLPLSRWHWPIRLGRIRLRKRLQPTEGWTRPSYVWAENSTIAAQAAEFVPRKGGASTCVPKSKPSCLPLLPFDLGTHVDAPPLRGTNSAA
jgi:hypothetical protein